MPVYMEMAEGLVKPLVILPAAIMPLTSFILIFSQCHHCQGVTPSNSKGGLPAPEAGVRVQEEGVEAELTQPLAGRKAHKTKQNQGIRVDSVPRWSREEPDQEACLKKEAERQGQPLVIDKTKEIQMSVYPVYIDYRKCGGHTHGPCARTSAQTILTKL